MVEKVTFKENHICFKKGDEIPLKPLTLLVGDQGCGKTTLLNVLKNDGRESSNSSRYIAKLHCDAPGSSLYLDFEKGSVRGMDINAAASRGISGFAVIAHTWASHGESVRTIVEKTPTTENVTMLLDEPDMALSMRSIRLLFEIIQTNMKMHNQQFILSVHNPLLMELVGEVYSLEHRKWMTYKEFFDAHKKGKFHKNKMLG